MSEKEQKFRHRATYFGQIFFFMLVLGGFTITGLLSFYASPIAGSIIAGAI